MTLHSGTPVRVEMTKWGDEPHWAYDAVHLGVDEHGTWLGLPRGTRLARPGAAFDAETDQVVLVPDAGWVATFHAPGYALTTYVDLTSVPAWDGTVLRCVDLDLDVIRSAEGEVWVDDEDEFAEHRVAWGYPADVVAAVERDCAAVLDAVRHERAPYDGATSAAWLSRVSPTAG